MKFIYRIFPFSFVITLPLSIFFIIWTYSTLNTYYKFNVFVNPLPKKDRLYRVGLAEYIQLKNKALSLFGSKKDVDVKFIINDKNIKTLFSDLPISGTEY